MPDPLSDDVRRFLDENVESLEQLEILRVLAEDPGRAWGVTALAGAIQAEPATAAKHLAALGGRGLITLATSGTETAGRHGARTPELGAKVDALLAAYRQRPVTMIKLVYERANERLRAFSDAFRLRKEE